MTTKKTASKPPAPGTAVWDALCKTDPAATKPFKTGMFSGTTVRPGWIWRRLTEIFGPCGIGWGYEIEEIVSFTDVIENNPTTICRVKVGFWFIDKVTGVKSELIPYFGECKQFYTSSSGRRVADDEASKKAVTDALKKCVSMIGMMADVFAGDFDKYTGGGQAKSGSAGSRARGRRFN